MILPFLIAWFTTWINRHQEQAIAYLIEENRILKAKHQGRRLYLTDADRRRLAILAHPIDRKRLKAVATIITVETLHRWYRHLVAQQGHGTAHHQKLGRPRVAIEIETLVVRMAEENASWGYRRLQGALANVGYHIDKITVRNILRRHHIDPAPQRHQTGMSWAQFVTIHWAVLTATGFFTEGIKPLAEVQTAAMQLGQDLVTSCIELLGPTHDGLLGVMRAGKQLRYRLGSALLSWARVWLAELETPCHSVVNRKAVGSIEGPRVCHPRLSTPASRQRLVRRAQPEREPPPDSSPRLTVARQRHPWESSASESRLWSAASVEYARSQRQHQSRHGDLCTPAVPAAA
jgi:hypothetical protein